MTELFGLLFLLATGPGLLVLGIRILRSGSWRESVPLAEAVIDRAFSVEPPPRNKWDRRFAKAQAWFLVIFGSSTIAFYTFLFVTGIVSE